MKPQFVNWYYRYHGKMPCGKGTWIFKLPQNQCLFYCNMLYSIAKKDAMRVASETATFHDCDVILLPSANYLAPA